MMCSNPEIQTLMDGLRGSGKLIVVSNREPFVHERRRGFSTWKRPAGGLTAALDPLLSACNGVWVAHGGGSADWDVVDRNHRIAVPPGQPSYTLRRVWLPEKQRAEYYNGLANRGLWPLCHNAYQRPRFSTSDWNSYREVNAVFAEAVLDEAEGEAALVFIQDYHLALLPRMLKERNPRLTLAHFWHIPWPHSDVFSVFPWKHELLDGLLGNDLMGFHLSQYCDHFLEAVRRTGTALVDSVRGRVLGGGNETTVRNFPIGIDFQHHCALADSPRARAATARWKRKIGSGLRVGIGIDRIDYTKGIPERIRGLDLFLERHPEWRGRLLFIQVGVPSRTDIPEYRALVEELEELVAAVNARWRTGSWEPVEFIRENLPADEMIALHRIADFCMVTPLHDGMNLVAKEFVASRSDLDGVLVLSRFAGASHQLTSAVLVNPFCEDEIADGIYTALNLPAGERRSRMTRLRDSVQANDIYQWAAGILSTLAHIEGTRWGVPALGAGSAAAARLARATVA